MAWLSREVLPFAAMVAVECALVGIDTIYIAASSKGLSYYVLTFYSYAINTLLLLLPLPFIFRGSTAAGLPPFKISLFLRIALLGLIAVIGDIAGYKGLEYSSPTLSSAMANLIPSFTFVMAVFFRMEKLDWRISSAQAKIIGTLVSMSGALVVTLYTGPTILPTSSATSVSVSLQQPDVQAAPEPNWVVGGILLATETLLYSIWYIIQTQVIKMYPAELVVVFLACFCSTIISGPICFLAEADSSAWNLKPDLTLVAVLYSGFFGYFFTSVTVVWGLNRKGPVYVSAFAPLSIVIAPMMSFIFLGDALHLGSIVGMVTISIGFYAVLWGKAKEEKTMKEHDFESLAPSCNNGRIPLLANHNAADQQKQVV